MAEIVSHNVNDLCTNRRFLWPMHGIENTVLYAIVLFMESVGDNCYKKHIFDIGSPAGSLRPLFFTVCVIVSQCVAGTCSVVFPGSMCSVWRPGKNFMSDCNNGHIVWTAQNQHCVWQSLSAHQSNHISCPISPPVIISIGSCCCHNLGDRT